MTGSTLTAEEARTLATEAFVFGYPLVLMDVTLAVSSNGTGVMSAPNGEAVVGDDLSLP